MPDASEQQPQRSEAAREQHSIRRAWATPGGRHDRIVNILNVALPASVGVLAAFLATAPLQQSNELNFLLSKDNVEIAEERLRVERARYSGADRMGRRFELNAAGAVQRSSSVPVVELEDLSAQLELSDGLSYIVANNGSYDMDDETISVSGPLEFRAPDGYRLRTSDVEVDLRDQQMRSGGDVEGQIPLGRFTADRMQVDIASRRVILGGRARLRIDQRGGR